MRCKNCGSENEENLYICQNCGSPLYDEEPIEETQDEMGKTKVVPVVTTPNTATPSPNPNNDDKLAQKKKNQTTVIIVVLAVVLAIVIGVLAGVIIHNSKAEETTSTTLPSTSQTTTQKPVVSSTTTTEPTTTTTTTQPTTTTTTTTTEVQQYMVEVSCSSGGTVIGRGMYEVNENCVVVATPDPGFVFDGWYINGKRVSSKPSYKFVVKADTNLEAVFTELISEEEE